LAPVSFFLQKKKKIFRSKKAPPVQTPTQKCAQFDIEFSLCPGTDVMIFKIFSPKKSTKKLAFLTENKAELFKKLIITLAFDKKTNFSPKNIKNRRKL
jgi:hypothetical protein